jgi:hypothetical protein
MKKKSPKKTPQARVRVPLRVELPQASSVIVSGSFTDWNETGIAFDRDGGGIWFVELELPPGRHEFRLIVDGEWADMPGAVETVENPYGTRNAVLVVGPPV